MITIRKTVAFLLYLSMWGGASSAHADDVVIEVSRFEGGVQVSSGSIPNCCSNHSMSSVNALQLLMKGCTTMGGYCMGSRNYAYVSFDLSSLPADAAIESVRLVGGRNSPRSAGGSVCVGFMPWGDMGSSMFNACTSGSTTFNWTSASNFSINLNPDQFNDSTRDRFAVVRLSQSGEYGSWLRNGKTNAAKLIFTLAVPPCPGDLLGDGQVDAADLGYLIADWGAVDSPFDLDGSGTVDAADLGVLLANWGPCPTSS